MAVSPRRVLVTGATGFIGSRTGALLVSAGYKATGLVRTGRVAPVALEAVEVKSLADGAAITRALEGVDAVVHLAALTHSLTAGRDEYWRTNVEGTRILLAAADAAGVERFVFLSSVKAVADESDSLLTEDVPPQPLDAYGESKLIAEQLVLQRNGTKQLKTSVLRIPMAYGPGMKGNILKLFGLVNRGVPLPVGRVHNRRSVVYVDNVAVALIELLSNPAAAGEAFFCADPKPLSTPELVTTIARALGRTPRIAPVPVWLLKTLARVSDRMGGAISSRIGSAVLDRLLGSLAVDTGKLARLGYRPPFDTRTGMDAAARWYLSRGSTKSDVQ